MSSKKKPNPSKGAELAKFREWFDREKEPTHLKAFRAGIVQGNNHASALARIHQAQNKKQFEELEGQIEILKSGLRILAAGMSHMMVQIGGCEPFAPLDFMVRQDGAPFVDPAAASNTPPAPQNTPQSTPEAPALPPIGAPFDASPIDTATMDAPVTMQVPEGERDIGREALIARDLLNTKA